MRLSNVAQTHHRLNADFTLVDLLVVISIIALLMGMNRLFK
jgi:Tfp pilus assembly protein FimT